MSIEDFKSLNMAANQLKDILSLPTKASLVKVPKGTTIWRGQTADNKWGIGGGIQIQVDNWEKYVKERQDWFKPLDNF